MARGRKPKPQHIRDLEASAHRDEIQKTLSKVEQSVPEPPGFLDEIALAAWHEGVARLAPLGLVSPHYRTLFGQLCQLHSDYVRYTEAIRKQGATLVDRYEKLYRHPLIGPREETMRQMMRLGAEFGMTPAGLTKIFGAAGAKRGGPDDEAADFFGE